MAAGAGSTMWRGGTRISWSGTLFWGVLILFLPLAFVGLVALPNEYESWGGSGVDCDGPAAIALAAWPSVIVYGIAALVFIRRAFRRRSWTSGAAVVACALLLVGLAKNIRAADREAAEPSYREICLN